MTFGIFSMAQIKNKQTHIKKKKKNPTQKNDDTHTLHTPVSKKEKKKIKLNWGVKKEESQNNPQITF